MHFNRKASSRNILLAMALVLAGVGAARAQVRAAALSVNQCRGDYVELRVYSEAEAFDIPVQPGDVTAVHFSEPISDLHVASNSSFYVQRKGNTVLMTALPGTGRDAMSTAHVRIGAGTLVALRMLIADSPGAATPVAVVTRGSEAEKRDRDMAEEVERTCTGIEVDAVKEALGELLLGDLRVNTVRSESPAEPTAPDDLRITDIQTVTAGDDLIAVKFKLDNSGDRDFPLAKVRLLDERREHDHAERVRLPAPFMSSDPALIAIIPRRTQVQGVVFAKEHVNALVPRFMEISAPAGFRLKTIDLLADDTDPHEGVVTLSFQGLYGVTWLANPLDEKASDATSVKGFGVRASFGFNRFLAVEGELIGASTGEARFEDVTYENMQGELTRRASLGRAQIGGVLRLGTETIPTIRLGAGLQGASHDARLVAASGSVPGPETPFEVSTMLNFGAGLDVRLGEHVLAGLGVAVSRISGVFGAEGTRTTTIEAGIHLGYFWRP